MESLKHNLLNSDSKNVSENYSNWLRKLGNLVRDPQVFKDIITICNRIVNDDKRGKFTPYLLFNHIHFERLDEAVQLFEENTAQASDMRGYNFSNFSSLQFFNFSIF